MNLEETIRFQETFYMMVNDKNGKEACELAISALKEVQRYHEIGTVEKCKDAVEKQIPKEPNDRIDVAPVIDDNGAYVDAEIYVNLFCPICGECVGGDEWRDIFCCKCGQAIAQEVEDD